MIRFCIFNFHRCNCILPNLFVPLVSSIRYCPPGSLRDQLLYPSAEHKNERRLWKDWSDDDLLNVLQRVDLPHLAIRAGDGDPYRGLNAILDWSNTLSLGEQQRLAFGRLVINRPRLVVMDESTSALDVVAEKKMYMLLQETSGKEAAGAGLTYVSVGHRPTLLAHHNLKLSLRDGDGYVSEIPPNTGVVDEGFLLG